MCERERDNEKEMWKTIPTICFKTALKLSQFLKESSSWLRFMKTGNGIWSLPAHPINENTGSGVSRLLPVSVDSWSFSSNLV
jgi:hypothetical protein